eukprot:355134-Chlamydomonas_euryale.AAC.3
MPRRSHIQPPRNDTRSPVLTDDRLAKVVEMPMNALQNAVVSHGPVVKRHGSPPGWPVGRALVVRETHTPCLSARFCKAETIPRAPFFENPVNNHLDSLLLAAGPDAHEARKAQCGQVSGHSSGSPAAASRIFYASIFCWAQRSTWPLEARDVAAGCPHL